MNAKLAGPVALVTGGASGLGEAIVKRLSSVAYRGVGRGLGVEGRAQQLGEASGDRTRARGGAREGGLAVGHRGWFVCARRGGDRRSRRNDGDGRAQHADATFGTRGGSRGHGRVLVL